MLSRPDVSLGRRLGFGGAKIWNFLLLGQGQVTVSIDSDQGMPKTPSRDPRAQRGELLPADLYFRSKPLSLPVRTHCTIELWGGRLG